MSTIEVPAWMRPPHVSYASHRGPWLDTWLAHHADRFDWRGWRLLPIHWFNLGLRIGNDRAVAAKLAEVTTWFTQQIPASTPCAAVYLWAIPFPRYLPNLFVAGTSHGHTLLPFVPRPMQPIGMRKTLSVSFVGKIDEDTDQGGVRTLTARAILRISGAMVSTKRAPCHQFDQIMEASIFTAAPRGYGPSSFRLYEAMGLGSIPIYVWDQKLCLPLADRYDWSRLAIAIHKDDLNSLPDRLFELDDATRQDMMEQGRLFYERHCTLAGAAKTFVDLLPPVCSSGSLTPPTA